MFGLSTLIQAIDLFGVIAFALSGALVGVRRGLDMFGVLVLSCVAAMSGGITRDVLIGATPPDAFIHAHYFLLACATGLVAFFWYPQVTRLRHPVQMLDAAGLALYCVTGAQKALDYGLTPWMAAILGMVTGIGGGIARDILSAQVPAVLRSDIYALAALAGAAVVVIGHVLFVPVAMSALIGALVCFALRMAAMKGGWRLPRSRWRDPT